MAPALCDCNTVSGISVTQHDRISFPWRTFEMKGALPPSARAKTAIEPAALYETSLGDAPRRHYAHVAPNGADDFGTLGVANARTNANAYLSLSEHMGAGLEQLGLSSWPKSASMAVTCNISRKICGISSDGNTRSRATPTHRSVICASTQNSAFSTGPKRVVDSLRHIQRQTTWNEHHKTTTSTAHIRSTCNCAPAQIQRRSAAHKCRVAISFRSKPTSRMSNE